MPKFDLPPSEEPVGVGCAGTIAFIEESPWNIIVVTRDPKRQYSAKSKYKEPSTRSGIPLGRVNPGEQHIDSARRELGEEVLDLRFPTWDGTDEEGKDRWVPADEKYRIVVEENRGQYFIKRRASDGDGSYEVIGEELGLLGYYNAVQQDDSERRFYVSIIHPSGAKLRTEGAEHECGAPWLITVETALGTNSPIHFRHRQGIAHASCSLQSMIAKTARESGVRGIEHYFSDPRWEDAVWAAQKFLADNKDR